jgi:hypothetical protein
VAGGDHSVTGGDDSVTGGDHSVTGGDDSVTGADDSVTGADDTVTGADENTGGVDGNQPVCPEVEVTGMVVEVVMVVGLKLIEMLTCWSAAGSCAGCRLQR